MRNEITTIRARATVTCTRRARGSGNRFTHAATWAAPAGMGRPTKKRPSTTLRWTLKRARRSTPHMTNRKAASQPTRGSVEKPQE